MITIETHPEESLVELNVSGRLTRDDYERLKPRLEPLLSEDKPLRCYIELHDFHGWQPGAFLEELRFDLKHRRQFGRMAVVGENRWEEWGTKVSKLFFPSEIRYFDSHHAADAHLWVREDAKRGAGVH